MEATGPSSTTVRNASKRKANSEALADEEAPQEPKLPESGTKIQLSLRPLSDGSDSESGNVLADLEYASFIRRAQGMPPPEEPPLDASEESASNQDDSNYTERPKANRLKLRVHLHREMAVSALKETRLKIYNAHFSHLPITPTLLLDDAVLLKIAMSEQAIKTVDDILQVWNVGRPFAEPIKDALEQVDAAYRVLVETQKKDKVEKGKGKGKGKGKAVATTKAGGAPSHATCHASQPSTPTTQSAPVAGPSTPQLLPPSFWKTLEPVARPFQPYSLSPAVMRALNPAPLTPTAPTIQGSPKRPRTSGSQNSMPCLPKSPSRSGTTLIKCALGIFFRQATPS